ncbi:MAG: AMP-binding protein [Ignavibacteria bacterium]|nr:AMP-binding protein [Ignavibacteria bacterium]
MLRFRNFRNINVVRHKRPAAERSHYSRRTDPDHSCITLFLSIILRTLHFSNHYGPSEAHVVTSYTFGNDTSTWPNHPPIGKPVFNNRIYILDNNLQPLPPALQGDLYIGGVSLVRGYLNRDELTKEKFKDDPL